MASFARRGRRAAASGGRVVAAATAVAHHPHVLRRGRCRARRFGVKAPLAWQVATYLGLTCFVHFAPIAWLPSILQLMSDQRRLAFATPALGACELRGLLALPTLAVLWLLAFGVGMSAALILSSAFIGLRAGSQRIDASLSGMAQGVV
jgi:cyanate permease